MFLSIFNKIKGYLALLAPILAAIGYAFIKGRSAGESQVIVEQAKQNEKVQQAYNEVDNARPDLDVAVSGLRKRAQGQ